MLTYIHTFSNWKNYRSDEYLAENVDAAKSFMAKRLAQKLEKKPSELTPEEREESLKDKAFSQIMELTKDSTGYALPMVKFHFDQGIPIGNSIERENFVLDNFFGDDEQNRREISNISQLLGWLKTRPNFIQRLPMSVDQYASKPTEQGEITGFEALADAIRIMELNQKARWFIDRLTVKFKNQFKQLPPEKQQILYDIGNSFRKLDDEDRKNPDLEKTRLNRFFEQIKTLENTLDIEGFIEKAQQTIMSYENSNYYDTIEKLEKIRPQAGIVYDKFPYLGLSCRTQKGQKDLCIIAKWCINNNSFSAYAGERGVQINIFNFNLPSSDPLFLTGTTILYDGKITSSCDINNRDIGNKKSIFSHFRSIGYPEDLCKTLEKVIPIEIITKRTLEKIKAIGKESSGKGIDMNKALWNVAGQKLEGAISQDEWNSILDVVTEVLQSEDRQLLNNLKQVYLKSGVHSLASLSIFEKFILDKLTPEEKEQILLATDRTFNQIKMLQPILNLNIETKEGEVDKNKIQSIERYKNFIALIPHEKEVKNQLRRLM